MLQLAESESAPDNFSRPAVGIVAKAARAFSTDIDPLTTTTTTIHRQTSSDIVKQPTSISPSSPPSPIQQNLPPPAETRPPNRNSLRDRAAIFEQPTQQTTNPFPNLSHAASEDLARFQQTSTNKSLQNSPNTFHKAVSDHTTGRWPSSGEQVKPFNDHLFSSGRRFSDATSDSSTSSSVRNKANLFESALSHSSSFDAPPVLPRDPSSLSEKENTCLDTSTVDLTARRRPSDPQSHGFSNQLKPPQPAKPCAKLEPDIGASGLKPNDDAVNDHHDHISSADRTSRARASKWWLKPSTSRDASPDASAQTPSVKSSPNVPKTPSLAARSAMFETPSSDNPAIVSATKTLDRHGASLRQNIPSPPRLPESPPALPDLPSGLSDSPNSRRVPSPSNRLSPHSHRTYTDEHEDSSSGSLPKLPASLPSFPEIQEPASNESRSDNVRQGATENRNHAANALYSPSTSTSPSSSSSTSNVDARKRSLGAPVDASPSLHDRFAMFENGLSRSSSSEVARPAADTNDVKTPGLISNSGVNNEDSRISLTERAALFEKDTSKEPAVLNARNKFQRPTNSSDNTEPQSAESSTSAGIRKFSSTCIREDSSRRASTDEDDGIRSLSRPPVLKSAAPFSSAVGPSIVPRSASSDGPGTNGAASEVLKGDSSHRNSLPRLQDRAAFFEALQRPDGNEKPSAAQSAMSNNFSSKENSVWRVPSTETAAESQASSFQQRTSLFAQKQALSSDFESGSEPSRFNANNPSRVKEGNSLYKEDTESISHRTGYNNVVEQMTKSHDAVPRPSDSLDFQKRSAMFERQNSPGHKDTTSSETASKDSSLASKASIFEKADRAFAGENATKQGSNSSFGQHLARFEPFTEESVSEQVSEQKPVSAIFARASVFETKEEQQEVKVEKEEAQQVFLAMRGASKLIDGMITVHETPSAQGDVRQIAVPEESKLMQSSDIASIMRLNAELVTTLTKLMAACASIEKDKEALSKRIRELERQTSRNRQR